MRLVRALRPASGLGAPTEGVKEVVNYTCLHIQTCISVCMHNT